MHTLEQNLNIMGTVEINSKMDITTDKNQDTGNANEGKKNSVKFEEPKDEPKNAGKRFSSKGASKKSAWMRTKTNVAKLAQMEMIKRANKSKKKKLMYQGRWVAIYTCRTKHIFIYSCKTQFFSFHTLLKVIIRKPLLGHVIK